LYPEPSRTNVALSPKSGGYRFVAPYQEREEHLEGPHRLTVPDSQFQELLPLENIPSTNLGNWEAPDPIRQGPFWAAGDKVKPNAHQRITSHLAIAYEECIDEQTFHIGKIIGYWHRPMHAGGQLPSVIRANIQEAVPTTYGSMYEVSPLVTQPGPAFTSTGFEESNYDGYPY
jgi:hypothetical protein